MMTSTSRAFRTAAQLREAAREVARLAARRGCPLPAWSAWQSTLELGPLTDSVPCARLHARQVLWEWGLGETGDAELLVSELVTNSVEAVQPVDTPQSLWLRLSARQSGLLIEVWDADPNPPVPPDPEDGIPSLDDENGRGLFLVGTLSHAWGWYPTRTPDGKVTWCELTTPLPLDRPPRLRRSHVTPAHRQPLPRRPHHRQPRPGRRYQDRREQVRRTT